MRNIVSRISYDSQDHLERKEHKQSFKNSPLHRLSAGVATCVNLPEAMGGGRPGGGAADVLRVRGGEVGAVARGARLQPLCPSLWTLGRSSQGRR